jgi:hypothetical protein
MIQKNLLKILFIEDLPSDVDLAVLELRREKLSKLLMNSSLT